MIKHLTQDVLPFWLKNAIDEEEGGIFTQLDRKGNIYGTEKSVWFQGRALYIFASAHNRSFFAGFVHLWKFSHIPKRKKREYDRIDYIDHISHTPVTYSKTRQP